MNWARSIKAKLFKDDDAAVICDLDALLTRTVGFRFGGRVHSIPPLSLENFMLATNALARLNSLQRKDKVTADEVLDAYAELFETVCPSITHADIREMGVQRIGALYQMVLELIMGKSEFEAQKKT